MQSSDFASIFIMSVNPNLKAAREVMQSRASFASLTSRPQRASASSHASSSRITKPLSIRAAASKHKGANRGAIERLIKKLEDPDSVRPRGRPRSLTDEEDEAIVAFVIWKLTRKRFGDDDFDDSKSLRYKR